MENNRSFKESLTQAAMAPRPRLEVATDMRYLRGIPLADKMRKMALETASGCLEWQGAVNNVGYGMVSYQKAPGAENRTTSTAHRKYWELVNGPIQDGMQVLHHCDNRRCINIDHLFLGDQTDNIRDMMAKGRDNFQGKGPYLKRKLSRS